MLASWPWSRKKEQPVSDPLSGPQPFMTVDEADLYSTSIADARTVVEYGCGGSTLLALSVPAVERIVSIETDPAWVAKLREKQEIVDAEATGRLQLVSVDIGPVGSWGYPQDTSAVDKFTAYPDAPWHHLDDADLVLVDGRFRVAATVASVRHVSTEAKIVIHDFWNRPHYHVVLPLLDEVAKAGTLAVFRRKKDFDSALADRLIADYSAVPK